MSDVFKSEISKHTEEVRARPAAAARAAGAANLNLDTVTSAARVALALPVSRHAAARSTVLIPGETRHERLGSSCCRGAPGQYRLKPPHTVPEDLGASLAPLFSRQTLLLFANIAEGVPGKDGQVFGFPPEDLAFEEEVVHDLRVSLRRIRDLLRTLATSAAVPMPHLLLARKAKAKGKGKGLLVLPLDRALSGLLGPLGLVRDADVRMELLAGAASGLPAAEVELLESIKAELLVSRAESLRVVVRIFSRPRTALALRHLVSWEPWDLTASSWLSSQPAAVVAPDLLFPKLSAIYLSPGWGVQFSDLRHAHAASGGDPLSPAGGGPGAAELGPPGGAGIQDHGLDEESVPEVDMLGLRREPCARLHELRKAVRGLRYALDSLSPALKSGPGAAEFKAAAKSVTRLQSVLGELHDLHVLASFLLPHAAGLPRLTEALAEKHSRAWGEFQAIKDSRLSSEGRAALYSAMVRAAGVRGQLLAVRIDLARPNVGMIGCFPFCPVFPPADAPSERFRNTGFTRRRHFFPVRKYNEGDCSIGGHGGLTVSIRSVDRFEWDSEPRDPDRTGTRGGGGGLSPRRWPCPRAARAHAAPSSSCSSIACAVCASPPGGGLGIGQLAPSGGVQICKF